MEVMLTFPCPICCVIHCSLEVQLSHYNAFCVSRFQACLITNLEEGIIMLEGKAEKHWPLQCAGCFALPSCLPVTACYPAGVCAAGSSLLLQGSLSVPVTTEGSPVAGLECFVLSLLVYVENQKKNKSNS